MREYKNPPGMGADMWDLRAGQYDGRRYKRWVKRRANRVTRRAAKQALDNRRHID